jgi:phosphatidylserine/phosphatidylglycerophosphate/cardiolipin synthase-like enzyme
MMYLVTVDNFVDAFIDAHQRGVDVRLMLDLDHDGNISARSQLEAAGVPLRDVPAGFTHGHTKAMLIDGDRAVVMSSNLNVTSMRDERNYGVIDRDPEDVADLAAIFDSDWVDDGGYPDLGCTRLVVSPVNARPRILQHINRAEQTLDMAVMYIADDSVESAVIQRHQAGVDVRVLLADPQLIDANVDTIAAFEAAGIEVRIATEIDMHAKLVVADGIPFVGSQNMSFTSLNENREIGVIITAETPAAAARGQFDTDWAAGAAP